MRLPISPEYNIPFIGVTGVRSPVGAWRGKGQSPAGPRCCSRPMPGHHRSIDIAIAGGGMPETSGEGATGVVQPGKRSGWSAPGQQAGELPCRCRTLLDSWSMSWSDGCVKRRAAAWSPVPWRTCQNADVERDRYVIADRPPDTGYGRPQACHRMRPDDRPTSQCFFLFSTEADWSATFALLGRCSGVTRVISARRQKLLSPLAVPYHLDTPLSFVSRHLCIWCVSHGRCEANKRSIDSKRRATDDNYPAHNRPIVGQLLVLILGSWEIRFLSRDREKRSRLETLESR